VRHAALDQAVYLTKDTIGCVAAAISLGMVDPEDRQPMTSPLPAYVRLMEEQSDRGARFQPPTPGDFTDGTVYACRDAGRPDFGLFGPQDSGRFATRAIARDAVAAMDRVEPADTRGVFFYANHFQSLDILPDVILVDVRPVELTRLLQGYQFLTGKAVQAWMNPLRAVDADLIARSILTGDINKSSYCLGARSLARFGWDRLGMGLPYDVSELMVRGMGASALPSKGSGPCKIQPLFNIHKFKFFSHFGQSFIKFGNDNVNGFETDNARRFYSIYLRVVEGSACHNTSLEKTF
jgi:uncharacterized protein (DUF169 family)